MIELAAAVDIGIVRDQNDDRVLLNGEIIAGGTRSLILQRDMVLAAVADGVGGDYGGGIAAEIALKELVEALGEQPSQRLLKQAVSRANAAVVKHQTSEPRLSRMSSTLAGVLIKGENLYIFNVGDSRVYRFRSGLMRQLTRDHSVAQQLVEMSYISVEQVKSHPEKNVLTRYLGQQKLTPEIEAYQEAFFEDDLILICSDGLTDMVDVVDIEKVLGDSLSLADKCSRLVELAKAGGGHDNISIVLILKGRQVEE